MHLIPQNALEILEFDKVLKLLQGYCIGEQAKALCLDILPQTDPEWINAELDTVQDVVRILEEQLVVMDANYPPLGKTLKKLQVEGYLLEGAQILEISQVLQQVRRITEFFDTEHQEQYAHLYQHTTALQSPEEFLEAIHRVLDEEGEVKPDASKTLQLISREMNAARSRADKAFEKLLRQYASQGWLADTQESLRNGRRVLAVLAENKRSIRGIVHDQSATGKTAFLEPEEMIAHNNDMIEMEAAYRAEMRRILMELCELLRPSASTFDMYEQIVTQIDLYLAKGRMARSIEATRPEVLGTPGLHMDTARHPLLMLKNRSLGKKTVPFDLELDGDNRVLLLSGPNAGGKSILMKSVGLLQVMVQSGLMVPVDARSRYGVFKRICVELGDKQSIEDDLSTYSSRLFDMKQFLDHADDQTLVLIDEFGSGTDPKLGGAIAEGILDRICKKGIHGVLTTHYSELKVYAFQKKGIVNGAMIFDQNTMSPSYKLRIGRPGSSFAFEIAEKTGLPKDVIRYARNRAGKHARALEELLVDLEAQKMDFEKRLRDLEEREKHADRLVSNYERLQTDLTSQRKRMRLEQKERDYQHLSQLNKDLEKAIRTLREEKNLEEAQKQLKKVKEARAGARKSIEKINHALDQKFVHKSKDLEEGDFVKLKNGSYTGKIERIERGNATIIVGQVRMDVRLRDLVPAADPLDINPHVSVKSDLTTSTQMDFDPVLDIRGLRAEDARDLLEKFLDGAMITSTSPIRIIHGKGTGALKRLVAEKLQEYPVSEISNPEDKGGGSGVTVVDL